MPRIAGCLVLSILVEMSRRGAVKRRKKRLSERSPFGVEDWCAAMPDISRKTIEALLPLISDAVKIKAESLQPTDQFDVELNLKDRFFVLHFDDSRKEIGRHFTAKYNRCLRGPTNGTWKSLQDVFIEAGPIIEKYGG